MSCNDDKKHCSDVNCVCDVVNFINELQDVQLDSCPTGCENPILGANCGGTSPIANTRPFAVFDKKGGIFLPAGCFNVINTASVTADAFELPIPVPSPFLRVESVDGDCCAVLRVLIPDVSNLSAGALDDLIRELSLFLPTAGLPSTQADFQAIARALICKYQNGITFRDTGGGSGVVPRLTTEFFGLASTNFCITVDLRCFCAIQCLRDTFVGRV
ncbi:CotY/CotZ family spore coat protein [Bacillus sp. XF8]|uniref:CotY/CotZ family spore coat protein n=1 Tax=Bacillus bingmayongensis TaxID=1150157 RepID=A0ABU5JS55_9BACI|nr:CotY/CotZ family spore coat protein [Bacillus sp. XF8]MBO1578131.1 spore coat protein [Bacillus sp. XF8]MDZ5606259.1 CotY/CotZ family spore coat protein [Bacillus pseudomycoides]